MKEVLQPTNASLKALEEAVGELARRGHPALQAEHILLGLLSLSSGAAAAALDLVGVDRGVVRERLDGLFPPGEPTERRGEVPYAPSGAAVLQAGMEEAGRAGTGRLSTAALLLGVLTRPEGGAYTALVDAGVDIPRLESALRAGAGAGDEPV
jgi:ATP-dependent Clp protease ATP-binding subunit ClpA